MYGEIEGSFAEDFLRNTRSFQGQSFRVYRKGYACCDDKV